MREVRVLTLRSTACEALWRRRVSRAHEVMVKLAFELSFVFETREVEVLESHEQGADTSRAHSLVIEVCERNVSAKYQREG